MSDGNTQGADVAIVGGGIAGVSAAASIAPSHKVVLLEQETELAHHTTSRSAAIYTEHDGASIFRRLSMASRDFFYADHEVAGNDSTIRYVEPLPVLFVGNESNRRGLIADATNNEHGVPPLRVVEGTDLTDVCPVLDPEVVTIGILEPTAGSIDVMAVHQHYLRSARQSGAEIARSARVLSGERRNGGWILETEAGPVHAEMVINAAGAWGDRVAASCGVEPLGLSPKRRTAFTARTAVDPSNWPFIYSSIPGLECYFKPEAGQQLLCSLSDEQPSEPCDARADEIHVAEAIEHINTLTTLDLRSVTTTWAGLRTFAPDRQPVFGWDDRADGFLWMVGQGGGGIISAPAAADVAGALVRGEAFPDALTALGLNVEMLAPRR